MHSKNDNATLLRLANATIEDFPKTQAQDLWAVFHDNLETELKVVGEGQFQKIRNEIAEELGYNKPSNVLKNPEAAARFIKRVYGEGNGIPIFDDIVNKITLLRET